jgi:hypothetical protein
MLESAAIDSKNPAWTDGFKTERILQHRWRNIGQDGFFSSIKIVIPHRLRAGFPWRDVRALRWKQHDLPCRGAD